MQAASAKQKGRKFQQWVRDQFLLVGERIGLVNGDVVSRSMGVSGEDIVFSPFAISRFGDVRIECKNQQSLNVTTTFWNHAKRHSEGLPILFHKRNNTKPLVTIEASLFFMMLGALVSTNHQKTNRKRGSSASDERLT